MMGAQENKSFLHDFVIYIQMSTTKNYLTLQY